MLGHGQHLLAEIKQVSDTVSATRMLPVVTGTDLGSLKQKGNLVAGDRGLRDSKEAARMDLESRQELRLPRPIKHSSYLVAERWPDGHSLHQDTPTTKGF